MADWFNNDLSDYIDKKEKVIIDVRKMIKFVLFTFKEGSFEILF